MEATTPQTGRLWLLPTLGVVLLVLALFLARAWVWPFADATTDGSVIAPPAVPPQEQHAVVSTEAKLLLDQIRSAYQTLQTAEFNGVVSSNIDADGQQEKTETRFTSAFADATGFRHEGEDDLSLGSTGEKVFVFNKPANEYLLVDAPETASIEELPAIIPEVLQAQNPSLLFALLKDPTEQFVRGFERISRGPDAEIGGRKHPVLVLESGQQQGEVTVVLEPDTHLVRQLRVDLKSALAKRGATNIKAAEVVVDYNEVRMNIALPSERFAWTPPHGAQDVSAQREPAEQNAAATLVGKPAPEFQLKTLSGESVSLADLKGQVVVLDFWASWCPPCIESLPHLGKLYSEERDGVKVFAVNVQEDQAKVQRFLNSRKIDVPVLLDSEGQVAQKYNVVSIPQTVVIGKDGTVRKVFVGLGDDGFEAIRKEVTAQAGTG